MRSDWRAASPPAAYRASGRGLGWVRWALAVLAGLIIAAAIVWLARPTRRLADASPPPAAAPRVVVSPRVVTAAPPPHVAAVPLAIPPPVDPETVAEPPAAAAIPATIQDGSVAAGPEVGIAPSHRHPRHAVPAPRPIVHHRAIVAVAAPSPRRAVRSAPPPTAAAAMHARLRPSFACRSGQGAIAGSICADQRLAALDRRVAARFATLDTRVGPASIQALHHGETAFLNARQLCPDKACLARVYRDRLRELDAVRP